MDKYQKSFLGSGKKLLLKFDGCRDKQFYTVGLIDMNDSMKSRIIDTESLIESTINILFLDNIEVDRIYSVLDYFIKLNTKLNNKIKEQLVFSLSIEYLPKLSIEIYIYVANERDVTKDSVLLKRVDSDIECERHVEQFINEYTTFRINRKNFRI